MNVKIEKPEKNVVKLEITVESQVFDECMDRAFVRNKFKFSIRFPQRQGARNLVERYYGEQVLYEDAINFACGDAYNKAIDEHDLEPVDRPESILFRLAAARILFHSTVTVKPGRTGSV